MSKTKTTTTPSYVTVKNTIQKRIDLSVTSANSYLTIETLLWFAREAQKAVDEGMDPKTRVSISEDRSSMSGVHCRANHTVIVDVE